jgi:hypothetical protein
MANMKLSLWKWLKAIKLFYTHRSRLSTCMLQCEIGVTYKVALVLRHIPVRYLSQWRLGRSYNVSSA